MVDILEQNEDSGRAKQIPGPERYIPGYVSLAELKQLLQVSSVQLATLTTCSS